MSTTRSSPRCGRRRRWRGTCMCRSSPATTASCARWAAATRPRPTCVGSSRSPSDFNLTSDVIVGFPAEDERAFERTLRDRRDRRAHACPRLPVLAAPGNRDGGRRRRAPPPEKRERSARLRAPLAASSSSAAGARSSARDDVVLVDRPGRGYGDDYSPFLVDAPVGELVRVRAAGRDRGGDPWPRRVRTACSAGSTARATTSLRPRGFVAIKDINPQAPVHLLVIPEQHLDTLPRRRRALRPTRPSACSSSSPTTARDAGPRGLHGAGERRSHRRTDGLPPPLAHPRPQARPTAPSLPETTAVTEL